MSELATTSSWNPPSKIEDLFAQAAGNAFAAINAPTAGARDDKPVPSGQAPFQLYSLATPNGIPELDKINVSIPIPCLIITYITKVISQLLC